MSCVNGGKICNGWHSIKYSKDQCRLCHNAKHFLSYRGQGNPKARQRNRSSHALRKIHFPTAPFRPDCIELGKSKGALPGCSVEAFECRIHGACTKTIKKSAAACCLLCDDYLSSSITPITLPHRIDEKTFVPEAPGYRFNSSILSWDGGYLFTYRTGWRDCDIYLAKMDKDFVPIESSRLALDHECADYGREDPRLFLYNGKPHISYIGVESRHHGRRVKRTNQMYAELNDRLVVSRVYAPVYKERYAWEKNWSFFESDGLKAVYTTSPHRILEVHENSTLLIHETNRFPWKYGEPRGGAPPVRVGDEFWSFFHSWIIHNGGRLYCTGLYAFAAHPPYHITRYVPEPLEMACPATTPAGHVACVFVGGAIRNGEKWILASGIHDRWSELHEYDHSELESRFISCA